MVFDVILGRADVNARVLAGTHLRLSGGIVRVGGSGVVLSSELRGYKREKNQTSKKNDPQAQLHRAILLNPRRGFRTEKRPRCFQCGLWRSPPGRREN